MRLQTTKNIQHKCSQVRGKIKNKHVVLSSPSHDDNVFNLEVLEPKVKHASLDQDYKHSQIILKLDQVSVVDKINLHKQIGEVIFYDLIQSLSNITKLKAQIIKLKRQILQGKVENKSWSVSGVELK